MSGYGTHGLNYYVYTGRTGVLLNYVTSTAGARLYRTYHETYVRISSETRYWKCLSSSQLLAVIILLVSDEISLRKNSDDSTLKGTLGLNFEDLNYLGKNYIPNTNLLKDEYNFDIKRIYLCINCMCKL